MWCRRRQRAPHGVGERCTSTPHDQHENAQRGHAHQGHTQQVHAPRAWETQARKKQRHAQQAHTQRVHATEHGRRKRDNASMHSASTKHGPVHPRDVDDVDERMSHDLGERCTSAPHAQHEGAQLEHTPHGHAQQAWARARTCRRQTAQVHRAHSTGTQACAVLAHSAKTRSARIARVRTGRAGGACFPCRVPSGCTLGAAAMPPPTSAARRSTGKRTRPAVTPPPTARRNRGTRPTAANRTSPGLSHRTPPAPAMVAYKMPPQPRRATRFLYRVPPRYANRISGIRWLVFRDRYYRAPPQRNTTQSSTVLARPV